MAYCWKCGLELDEGRSECPLCNVSVPAVDAAMADSQYPIAPVPEKLSGLGKQFLFWKFGSFMLLSSFLILLTVNLVLSQGLSWGRYPLSAVAFAWIILSLCCFVFTKQWLFITGMALALTGFLALLDSFNGRMEWFVTLGLPIVGIAVGYQSLLTLLAVTIRVRLLTFLATNALVLTIVCIGIDLLVSAYVSTARMSWSFIVMAVLLPLSGFLFYARFSLSKRVNLDKFFHV